jgi:hypothetical protein
VWFGLFTVGLVVNAKVLLARYNPLVELEPTERMEWGFQWANGLEAPWDFLVLFLCYTPTNVALLCVCSGLLGVMGARVRLGSDRTERLDGDSTHPYLSGLLRGFFVYLILLSGMLVLSGNPFANLTSGDYVRLAGLVSAFSFALNYAPRSFEDLLHRVLQLAARQNGENDKEKPRGERPSSP